jgi:hypothetical protein
MATYTAITDAEIDQDSPITQTLMTKYRDNLIAVTEGDASAPKIAYPAISDALTGVSGRGVGSYTVAWYAVNGSLTDNTYVSIAVGTEVAGTSLRSPVSVDASGSTNYLFPFSIVISGGSNFPTSNTETLAGTWRLMTSGKYRSREDQDGTIYFWFQHLWMRIS